MWILTDEKEILFIMGGSLGSQLINNEIRKNLNKLLKEFNIIHICGKGNIDQSLINKEGYKQFEYVSEELPHLMKCCRLYNFKGWCQFNI